MKSLLTNIILVCAEMAFAGVVIGRGRFKVRVFDAETGQPLAGINVHGVFDNYPRGWGISAKHNTDDAVTDINGVVSFSGSTEKGTGGYQVRGNPGFYDSEWERVFFKRRVPPAIGMWIPYDIVSTMRLDRVVNPIPLWVARSRKFRLEKGKRAFTNDGAVASYDLMKNEWLPPFGDGSVADIRFTCRRKDLGSEVRYSAYGDSTVVYYRRDVEVHFLGDGNGLIEVFPRKNCGIKLRTAPETGYKPKHLCWMSKTRIPGELMKIENKSNFDKERCFYFRIRTELDEEGKVKSAIYGKVYRDFSLIEVPDGCGYNGNVGFSYYLNPNPNDRNLEWDQKANYCPNPVFVSPQLGP